MSRLSFNLTPILPIWAVVAVAAVLALLLVQGSLALLRKKVPARWVTTLAILRAIIVAVLVVALLQPVVSFTRKTERRPDLLVMIDTSQSMGIAASDGKARLDSAFGSLRKGGLLSNLSKRFDVHYFAFDRNAYPLDETDLGSLKPAGDSTHFADSLATAATFKGDSSAAPTRALLVSDGDDLGSDDVVATAQKLGIAVDALALDGANSSSPQSSKVVIASVQSPRSVMLGSETQIVATLRADGAPRGDLQLSLLENCQTLANVPVTFRAGESEQTVRLAHRPTEVGVRQYELRLSDQTTSPYQFTVRVTDAAKQVAILGDTWRWDFKFLRRAIEDDPSFSFTALLSRGGGTGAGTYAQFAEADRKINLAGFPQNRADLLLFDTIVLGDVNPRRWPPALASGIAQLVKDEGKSLIVIAGPNLKNLAATTELNGLLPVEVTEETATPIEGPIEVMPTREGVASPFFTSLSRGALPALDRIYPPLRKKPAASILLEANGRANTYGNLIVMAEHTVGRGRVLFIGTDALWNWQTMGPLDAQGVTPYAAFWQQAMRAMSPVHSRSGDVSITLQPDRSRYEVGQRVLVRAQYKTDRPLPAAAIASTLTLPDQKQIPLTFEPDPSEANAYRAAFDATLSGQYRVAADVTSEGKMAADAQSAIDVEAPRGEMNSTRIDEANLARIASATGGKLVRAGDSSTWPTVEMQSMIPVEETRRVDLWGNLTLLIVLCTLLGTDWLLRLLRGYV